MCKGKQQAKLQNHSGISRNAVIGKAHRLNLSAKIKTEQLLAIKALKIQFQIKIINQKRSKKPI